jgi:transcriptional regulator with XRE-family HTH domain
MSVPMSVAPQLDQLEPSPLASARLQRKLTVEEAAKRAGIAPEQIEWLEAGRVYRFPNPDDALVAAVVYATSLGIDANEARSLARLPMEVRPDRHQRGRVLGAAAAIAVLAALAVALVGAVGGDAKHHAHAGAPLPPPWKLTVDVLNGGGDIYYTRQLADKIGAMGYRIHRVAKADRFDYPKNSVYFEPGGEALGRRLAEQLGVDAQPLPGGSNPRRLVVIAGRPRL